MVRYFDPMCEPKQNLAIAAQLVDANSLQRNYSHELAHSCQQIDEALMDIFLVMFWHVLIIVLLFLLMTIWFIGVHLGFILAMLIGVGVITLIFWFALKFASRSLSRILIHVLPIFTRRLRKSRRRPSS